MTTPRDSALTQLLLNAEREYQRRGWDRIGLHLYSIWPKAGLFGQHTPQLTLMAMPLPERIARGGAGIAKTVAAYFTQMGRVYRTSGLSLPPPEGYAAFCETWCIDHDKRDPKKLIADQVGARESRSGVAVLADGTIVTVLRHRGCPATTAVDSIRNQQVGLAGALWTLMHEMRTTTVEIPPNFGWCSPEYLGAPTP